MQNITDPPRTGLDPVQVGLLLQGAPSITVAAGAQLVNADLSLGDDLSAWLRTDSDTGGAPPTVESDSTATIHRSCTAVFDAGVPINYLSQFVLLYSTFTNNDTGFSARFNMGIYVLSSPTLDAAYVPNTWEFDGYDLLSLYDSAYGDTYYVAPGASIDDAITDLIHDILPNAVVNGSTGLIAGATGLTWPFDESDTSTYLDIINNMLEAAGYLDLWVDWNGEFHLTPAPAWNTEASEYTFDTSDDDNIVAESRQITNDLSDVPNKWQFIMSGLNSAPVEGQTQYTYTDNRANSPTSTTNRGRIVFKPVFVDTATSDSTSYTNLVQAAQNTIQADLATSEQFAVNTSPFPLAWHYDSITYNDDNIESALPFLSNTRHVIAQTWETTLDGSADTSWTWSTVQAL